MAAASAGKVPPGSTEKPIGPEMRKAIDGPSDPSLPRRSAWNTCASRSFAPGNDPRVWLGGWNEAVHHMESHARNHTPVDDTSRPAAPRSSTCRPSTTRWLPVGSPAF